MKYIIIALALVFANCATNNSLPVNGGVTKDDGMITIPVTKTTQVPEWFVIGESADSEDMTVVATDVSKDMQFAIDKAMLNAKVKLAEKIGTKIDSLVRESSIETGAGTKDVEKEVDRVTKSRTSQEVSFYTREQLTIVREGSYYRAYILLRLKGDEARKLSDDSDDETREDKFRELDEANIIIEQEIYQGDA